MNIQQALEKLLDRQNLSDSEMEAVMQQVMTGEATQAQIGGFLVALRMKGESVDEVTAAARVMRNLASPVSLGSSDAIDIVGTGGDATSTFNISSCCSIVAAAAGARVAKHGNRSVSSKSGAADLLEEAGVNLDLSPEQVAICVDTIGLGFMFAPRHHSAMKHAIGPRREMGIRTIFNLLGPLTNPAAARSQLLGVYDRQWVRPMAEVLKNLGSHHVMVVHGHDGMDEISISGPSHIAELKLGEIREYTIDPAQFGLAVSKLDAIKVDGPKQSLALIQDVLADKAGPAHDIVVINSAAALCVADQAETIEQAVETVRHVLSSGAAAAKLAELIKLSQSFAAS